jgi:FtsP/CotA-like multicopper oxidase with cupredoxin domain
MKLVPAALAAGGHGHSEHETHHGHGHDGGDDQGGSGAHAAHEHNGHDPDSGGHQHADAGHDQHDEGHNEEPHARAHGAHNATGGIEWEDDMVDVNRLTTPANMRWQLVDRATGAVNHAIDWQFRVGDQVKLRLVNEMDSDHPMHHPFHVHGAGRFVVLARDGVAEPNLVWKDTVLVRTGETIDILLDVTNAGIWMAHCHIAEHHESGMMFSFNVAPAAGQHAARDGLSQ